MCVLYAFTQQQETFCRLNSADLGYFAYLFYFKSSGVIFNKAFLFLCLFFKSSVFAAYISNIKKTLQNQDVLKINKAVSFFFSELP